MEAIISLCAIIVLSLVALRLGTRSPATSAAGDWSSVPGTRFPRRDDRSSQQIQPVPNVPREAGTGLAEPLVTRILWAPVPAVHSSPLLQAIDTVSEPRSLPFALDHDAARLEAHAQAWAAAHWSETTWLTGHIRQDRIDAICDELERERQDRRTVIHVRTDPASANQITDSNAWTSVANPNQLVQPLLPTGGAA